MALGAGTVALAVLARRRSAARDRTWFADRVVLIPGGTRGLGFALARQLASDGARVTICGRDEATAKRAEERLAEEGLRVEAVACDIRDPAAALRLVRTVEARTGAVDVLINDAGVIEVGSVWDQSLDDFRESVETHIYGPLHTMRAVLPSMRARRTGRIANIASVGGLVAPPHLAPYAAGKFGLVGLSQAFAAEVAHDGVAVTCICPGLMRTGSPDHAIFKGRTRAEYTWFALSDSNPLLSASTEHSVRVILRAIVRRTPFVTITPLARAAMLTNAIAPNLTARILAGAARVLPPPRDDDSVRATGENSHSALAPSLLTALDRIAKRQNNQ